MDWNEKGTEYLVAKEYQKAEECFRKAAEEENFYAMYNLACMYYFGDGVEKDDAASFHWFSEADRHGDAEAANRVGIMLENGIGTEADPEAAFDAYLRSAEGGSLSGMANLGQSYLEGKVRQDVVSGLYWMERASKEGNGIASLAMGEYSLAGTYGEADPAQAKMYFERGMQQKYAPAILRLADLYEEGIGVEKDLKKSAELRELAANTPDED